MEDTDLALCSAAADEIAQLAAMPPEVLRRVRINLVPYYFAQIPEYWFRGPKKRFAQEAGISAGQFSRIWYGAANPRFETMLRVATVLERKLGRTIDLHRLYRE